METATEPDSDVRIINVCSDVHMLAPSIGWFPARGVLNRHVQLFNLDKVWPV